MKRTLFALFLTLIIILIFSTAIFAANELENNNSSYSATSISVNTAIYGNTESSSDSDWYMITLDKPGAISVQFDHEKISSANAFWNISFYQSDGSSGIAGSTRFWEVPGDKTSFTTAEVGVDAGTYYIKIEPYASYRYDSSTYTMKVNYTSSTVWEKENNNSIYNATPLTLNTDSFGSIHSSSDQDWYLITINESGYFSVQFDHEKISSANAFWYISLYQSDGSSGIAGSTRFWEIPGDKTSFTTAEVGVDAGTYYVKIEPYASYRYDSSTYTVKVNYISSTVWEKENNNSTYNATPLSLNSDNFGSIFSSTDQDWFSFELKADAEVSMSFSHATLNSSNEYWYISIFTDERGSNRLGDVLGISGDKAIISADLGKLSGNMTYYIQISPYSSSRYSGTTYTLHVNEKHDHIYGEWIISQEPTCTESGIKEQSCIVCNNIITEQISPYGHSFSEWEIDTEATCTKPGMQHHTCIVCGITESEETELIPHTFDSWSVVKNPTCVDEGLQQRVCKICGQEETGLIEKLPHEFREYHKTSGSIFHAPIILESSCINCGYIQTYENYDFQWVTPLLIAVVILAIFIIVLLYVYKNRKKLFKTSFVCPYCFETHKLSEVEFRCSNNLCKDVQDLPMTKYENGDLSMPLFGKPTFKSTDVERGKKFIPRAASCPECHRITHKVICPSCHNILPESTLLGEDMIISIVGSRDTGKSHFVGVIVNELIERVAPAFDGSFEGFDDTMERYEQSFGKKLYVDLQKLDLTQSSLQNINNGAYRPLIFSLKLQIKKGLKRTINRYTLVFFDTAGEDLDDADTMSTVNKYICKSSGIIFLLDPMKIPDVTAQLDEDIIKRASSISWQHASRSDDILVRVSNLIRNDRALKSSDKIDVPVAVVFSKFDIIEPIIPQGCAILTNSPHCTEKAFVLSDWHNVNSEVQGLLRTWGAESFLSQLEVNYTDYSCFAVSSLGLNNNPTNDMKISRPRPHRIEDPLLWILMKLKVIKTKK